jgi:phosphate-selective porin OprO/OprP
MRDTRLLFKGRLKFPNRKVTWSAGLMYDGVNKVWLVRQTGIQIDLPEIKGNVFIGRQKEGFSMSKIMVGYHGWGIERMPMNDNVQLLADGIKVTGYARRRPLTWNFGVFTDALSEKQSFSIADHQVIGRLVWQPILSDEGRGNLLHVGVALRYAKSDDGQLQPRSRPEAYLAPYFVDTGKFPANSTTMTGLELYYRPGPLLIGSEYMFQHVDAPEKGNPYFHGGEVSVVWLATGETRSYNRAGGYFNAVSPARSVFRGGPGAWELVARYSYIDLDSGPLRGGKFWRITPMVNWHLDDSVRLEFVYGYGTLDRFSLVGHTQFFQSRLQLCF